MLKEEVTLLADGKVRSAQSKKHILIEDIVFFSLVLLGCFLS